MISINEYNDKLNLTLQQKIDHSLYIIDTFLATYKDSVIAFSGGIDSSVMLTLIRLLDRDRKAVFANTTNEFSDILRFVKKVDNVEIVESLNSIKDHNFINIELNVPIVSTDFPRINQSFGSIPTSLSGCVLSYVLKQPIYFRGEEISEKKTICSFEVLS